MNIKERSKTKTRSSLSSTRSSFTGQYEDSRSTTGLQKNSKSTGMSTNTTLKANRNLTYSSGTKEGEKRRTTSLKPLCQRSQQRHEHFRAEFEQKMLLNNSQLDTEPVRNRGKKTVVPRPMAGKSLPPRLPSVKKTKKSPSATKPTTVRKQVFPKPSPEALYRPRSVREQAAKEKFLQQPGARPLNLTPPVGATFYDTVFDPISPTVYSRGASCEANFRSTGNPKSRWYAVHGTTPPAEVDVDSDQFSFQVQNKWHSPKPYNRHQTKVSTKQQYRLKSQQFQVDKMKNAYRTKHYDMSYEEVDSPLALYDRGEEDFEYA
eukprot:g6840.t1